MSYMSLSSLSGLGCQGQCQNYQAMGGVGCMGCKGMGCNPGAACASCAGLGVCPVVNSALSGLGQESAGVASGILSLIDQVIGVGAKFIPETKEMRERREQETLLAQAKAQAEAIKSAATTKNLLIGGAVLGGLALAAKALFGKKKGRRK